MQVVKRDGSIVAFDRSKIVSAIQKANHSVDEEERISQDMIERISRSIEQRHRSRLLVEDIQDMVERQPVRVRLEAGRGRCRADHRGLLPV